MFAGTTSNTKSGLVGLILIFVEPTFNSPSIIAKPALFVLIILFAFIVDNPVPPFVKGTTGKSPDTKALIVGLPEAPFGEAYTRLAALLILENVISGVVDGLDILALNNSDEVSVSTSVKFVTVPPLLDVPSNELTAVSTIKLSLL